MTTLTAPEFKTLFETAPGMNLVLEPDLTIVAASKEFMEKTMTIKETLIGRHFFERVTADNDENNIREFEILKDSLNYVLTKKLKHEIPEQKFNINYLGGLVEEKYFHTINIPVLDSSKQVTHIIHSIIDITDKKISEIKFRSLLDAAPDATIMTNQQGIIEMVNTQTEILMGYSKEELIGQPVEIIVPQKFRHKHVQQRNSFLEADKHRDMGTLKTLTALKKDGTIIPVDISLTPIHTERGVMIFASIRNISKRLDILKKLETQARQINQSNDAIITIDRKLKTTSWNNGAEKIYGYTFEEAFGKDTNQLLQSALTDSDLQSILKQLDETDYWTGEIRRKTKAGKEIYVYASISTLRDTDGTISGYLGVSLDITEQKKLREEVYYLASIVEQSTEGIISVSMDQKIISWNKGAEELLGYSKEEAIGKRATELGYIRVTEAEKKNVNDELFRHGRWTEERLYYRKDGSTFFGTFTANTVKNGEGEIRSLVFIIKDISLRKELEEQLQRSNDLLEEKVKARTAEFINSEKKYSNLFKNNPMPMWVIDNNTYKFLDVNEMAILQFGYTKEEFLALKALDIMPAEDREIFISSYHSFEKNNKNYNRGIWNHLKKDGTVFQAEIIIHQIVFDGKNARLILSNDVTEKLKAEKELVAREKRFRALIENNYDIIALVNDSQQFFYRSPSAARITGWPDEEMVGGHAMSKLHPEDKAKAMLVFAEILANPGKPVNSDFRYQHKDGHYLWFEGIVVNLLHDEAIKAIVFNFRDVSVNKQIENALREERDKFAIIAVTTPDLIYSFRRSKDGTFSFPYASHAIIEIFGYSYEILEKNVSIIFNDPIQVDGALVYQSIENSAKNLVPWRMTFRYIHPKKGLIWLEGNSIPNAEPDGGIIWHGIISDITERKNTEDKLNEQRAQLQTLSDNLTGVLIFQISGDSFESRRFTYLSNGVSFITGKTAEEVMEDPSILYSMILEEDIPGLLAAELESFKNMSVFNVEVRCRNYKNELRWLNIVSTPRKMNNGRLVWDGYHLDITERKLAATSIIASEEKYRTLVEQAFDGVIIYTIEGKILECNNSACINTGYTAEELKMINATDLLFPDDLHSRPINFDLVKTGKPVVDYRKLKRKDGSLVDMELVTRMLPNGNLIAVGRDITEQKQARAQQALFSNIVNSSDDAIISKNLDGIITSWNRGAEKIFGYSADEAIGKNINILVPKDLLFEERLITEKTRKGEIIHHFESKRLRKDGNEIFVSLTASPLKNRKGEIVGASKIARDISERKKAEELLAISFYEKEMLAERMSVIINTLPANIALLDEDGVIIEVNDAWRAFADCNGYEGNNYGIGDNYIDISKSATGDDKIYGVNVSQGISDVLQNKQQDFVYEYPCHSPHVDRWFRMVVSPLKEKGHSGAVVMHVDISELRRMEQERMNAKMEEQKNMAKAMLLGQEKERNHIGHELHDNINQLLAGTKLHLGLAGMKDASFNEFIKYPMELIDHSIDEIRLLCHQLVTPGKNINLEEMVQKLVENLDETTSIETVFEYEVSSNLLSDELKLNIYRIIQEEINNIIKHAEASLVKIILKTEGKYITISIIDNGKGYDTGLKRKGIGISNMINRVESFNGSINIESSKGKGCNTLIRIPI